MANSYIIPKAERNYSTKGGRRLDRVLRIYLEIPKHVPDGKVMDFIEEVLHQRIAEIGVNPDTVCVRKHTFSASDLDRPKQASIYDKAMAADKNGD